MPSWLLRPPLARLAVSFKGSHQREEKGPWVPREQKGESPSISCLKSWEHLVPLSRAARKCHLKKATSEITELVWCGPGESHFLSQNVSSCKTTPSGRIIERRCLSRRSHPRGGGQGTRTGEWIIPDRASPRKTAREQMPSSDEGGQ